MLFYGSTTHKLEQQTFIVFNSWSQFSKKKYFSFIFISLPSKIQQQLVSKIFWIDA